MCFVKLRSSWQLQLQLNWVIALLSILSTRPADRKSFFFQQSLVGFVPNSRLKLSEIPQDYLWKKHPGKYQNSQAQFKLAIAVRLKICELKKIIHELRKLGTTKHSST